MSVRVEDSVVWLEGRCAAADAEPLLAAVSDQAMLVDLSRVERMHFAVLQVLLAAHLPVRGIPKNEFIAQHVIHLLK